MKRQGNIIIVTVLVSTIFWSCTKTPGTGIGNSTSLKQAVNQSASNLNTAMNTIANTKAFSILTINDGTLKSASTTAATYKVYITLDSIKGVYDYKPVPMTDRWGWSLVRFFTKTASSSQMIVNMPLSKVQNPRSLRHFSPADSTLKNNFSIAVSDYHNNYNSYWDYDYLLASQISIDNAVAGDLNILSKVSPTNGIQYASQYQFAGSYTAKYQYTSGDTTVSSFDILSGTNVLYEEKLVTVKNDTARFGRERQYSLTIGNVTLTRRSGSKTTSVFVNGVLQPTATVTIVDRNSDSEPSVTKHRDIQITFADGTTTTVSALIGQSITNISTLFDSLHSVFFAAYIVDWIAYDVYYHRN